MAKKRTNADIIADMQRVYGSPQPDYQAAARNAVRAPRGAELMGAPSRVKMPEDPSSLGEMATVLGSAMRNAPQGAAPVASMLGDMGKFAGKTALLALMDQYTGGNSAYRNIANNPNIQEWWANAKQHPVNEAVNMIPLVGDAKGVGEMMREAVLARRHGDTNTAQQYESMLLPVGAMGLIPEVGGAAVNKLRGALSREATPVAHEAANVAVHEAPAVHTYSDPAAKSIADWQWRPFEDVKQNLGGLQAVPPHVVDFGRFMQDQAAKASGTEGLSPRDLIKAYGITRSSIQRQALPLATAEKYGADLSHLGLAHVRPEGSFAELLGTPEGQAYLDAAERGQLNRPAIDAMMAKFKPYGFQNTLGDDLEWGVSNLPQHAGRVSDMVAAASQGASDPSEWTRFVRDNISGVNAAKAGFVGSMLGRGDLPTLDARQIILNTGQPTDLATKYLARKEGSVEGVQRLASRMAELGLELPEDLKPYYQHLAHHSVWDKTAGEATTHADLMNAMKHFSHGGFAVKGQP